MYMSKNIRKESAITLVALVVTIITLLILAGISIAILTRENGIVTKANEAKTKTEEAQEKEKETLENLLMQLDTNVNNKDNINIQNFAIGWNLGNSLDCSYEENNLTVEEYETMWNNPVTTKEMIRKIKESGFSSIRIPVTWFNHLDNNNNIKDEWMSRVKEVVDYAIDCNMYVILNTHHDDDKLGIEDTTDAFQENIVKYKKIWKKIANTFKDYPYNLTFELLNEPIAVVDGEEIWYTENQDYYDNLNNLTEELLETVRSTGGNNSKRYVFITTYGGNIDSYKLNYLKIPQDDYIAVAVSAYIDYEYCTSNNKVFDDSVKYQIEKNFKLLTTFSRDNNIPVLIKETGAYKKSDRDEWIKMIYAYAFTNKIPIMWWDSGNEDTYKIFDRNSLKFTDENAVRIMKKTFEVIQNIDSTNNIIDEINYTNDYEKSDIEGMGVRKENGKNYYFVNQQLSSSVRFKFSNTFNLNNDGIYQFSCKIKTNMNDLDLKYVMNFFDNNDNLIYQQNYSSITYNLVNGSRDEYQFNALIFVDNAYKVQLERVHTSINELSQISYEIYDFSLKAINLN